MPQLVKGGKNTFGWSQVGKEGRISIPPDAFAEYQFIEGENAIVMSGSKKSGGFGLTNVKLLKQSPLSSILHAHPELAECKITAGSPIHFNSKIYCWIPIRNKSIIIPLNTLLMYGIKREDFLLTVRGSNLALGFIVKGPIIEEAKKHPELKIFA
jgi:hypothetical protein